MGGVIIVWRTPSMRILTYTCFSIGSMWISVALSLMDSWKIRFTSLTIGASSSDALSGERSTSSWEPSSPETTVILSMVSVNWAVFWISPYTLSRAFSKSSGPATKISGFNFVSLFIESTATTSSGSSMATVIVVSLFWTARTLFSLAKSSGTKLATSESASNRMKLSAFL